MEEGGMEGGMEGGKGEGEKHEVILFLVVLRIPSDEETESGYGWSSL